jgi:hypothetical protein
MGGLFSAPKVETPKIEKPRPIRMPTETDADMASAAQRTRKAAINRRGRLSTILTDQTKGITGSSGQKLGA